MACVDGKWLFRERWPPVKLPKHQRQLRSQRSFPLFKNTLLGIFRKVLFCTKYNQSTKCTWETNNMCNSEFVSGEEVWNFRLLWFVFWLFCHIWQLLDATRTTIRDMGACVVSNLLLFFKRSLQLSVAQVGVHLLSIPTSPPGGNRAATQLGPDPTFFEQQPAEAGVPAGGVPVMGAGSVATIPKAVQSCYGCHHYRQQLDDLACHHHLDPHPGHLWNCGSLFQTAQ